MKKQPLLSICIPTYKREYLIEQLLDGILGQKCDPNLYDICITDNSETDETQNLIQNKYKTVENLYYKKVQCQGFMNSIEALKLGDGLFLKLHNDYSMFNAGSLQALIDSVREFSKEKPVVFYSLRGKKCRETFNNFDSFMKAANYLTTWSTSFSIWKEDFDLLIGQGVICNYMYPHTSLLFAENYKKSFVIDDALYFENLMPKKKGGYNLIDNFVRIFLTMVQEDLYDKKLISKDTYKVIERNILRFCAKNFVELNGKEGITYTFEKRDMIIKDRCGQNGYTLFNVYAIIYRFLKLF